MNIDVTIRLAPEALEAIKELTAAFAPKTYVSGPAAPDPIWQKPEEEAVPPAAKLNGSTPKKKKAEKDTLVEDQVLSLEIIQELTRRKAQGGHKEAIKALLNEFGAAKVTDLKEEQFDSFHTKVSAL